MKKFIPILFFIFCFVYLQAQVPSYVPTQDLEAWYSFNGNTNDLSGNSNLLTNNGATLTTDRNNAANKAYSYNGTNNNMVNLAPSFIFGADSSFTVSFWMKKNNNTSDGFPFWHGKLQSQGASGKFVHFISTGSAGSSFKWGTNKQGSAWAWASTTYSANVWEHYVCVYSNKYMQLYKDGIVVNTNNFTHTGTVTAVMPFYLGSNSNSLKWFNGKIDDVGVWNRALTPSEITTLNTACNTVIQGPTVAINTCGSYISANGNIYTLSGTFTDTLSSVQGCDSVVTLNLTINPNSGDSIIVYVCEAYTSPSGNHTWNTSGIYNDTIPNAIGCDSIITINLIVTTVDNTVTANDTVLTANATNVSYQWLDCDNNFAVLPGISNMSYQPAYVGNYAVEITENGCMDTSSCYSMTYVGFGNVDSDDQFEIFPNPTSGTLTLSTPYLEGYVQLSVYDVSGKKLYSEHVNGADMAKKTIDLSALNNGVYFIQIKTQTTSLQKMILFQK